MHVFSGETDIGEERSGELPQVPPLSRSSAPAEQKCASSPVHRCKPAREVNHRQNGAVLKRVGTAVNQVSHGSYSVSDEDGRIPSALSTSVSNA